MGAHPVLHAHPTNPRVMSTIFHRLRSTEKLFEFRELESQEIFFASPEALNDPMEGYRDVFWHGDEILWASLFKNYALSFLQLYIHASIAGPSFKPRDADIPVFSNLTRLPTEAYRQKIAELFATLFGAQRVKTLLAGVSKRGQVRRDELQFYLWFVHIECLAIAKSLVPQGNSATLAPPELPAELFDLMTQIEKTPEQAQLPAAAFEVFNRMMSEMTLISVINNAGLTERPADRFLIYEFPSRYLAQLENLMYPPWYTACFFADPTSPAMWGYYAQGHSGVCLRFRSYTRDGRVGLPLETVIGSRSTKRDDGIHAEKIRGQRFFPFHDVVYGSAYRPVDFFRSIGRLPFADLKSAWFSNADGTISPRVKDIAEDADTWRAAYWEPFYLHASSKLGAWQHEKESRLVLHSNFGEIEPSDRKLSYTFDSLEGIIFGARTPMDDRLRIMSIIDKKCTEAKRNDFNFYQARYSAQGGEMKIDKMSFLTPRR